MILIIIMLLKFNFNSKISLILNIFILITLFELLRGGLLLLIIIIWGIGIIVLIWILDFNIFYSSNYINLIPITLILTTIFFIYREVLIEEVILDNSLFIILILFLEILITLIV
ncbi:hypothetical protein (mitochondrion) [Myxobolus squamalis]|uniref:Uncharacterized protein n=1 Tax=Myxobolus squamalis TaxID=59785 RepID=A0A678XF29_MYXSQ|nr:hypothetical protein [Myxobolus squamalis]